MFMTYYIEWKKGRKKTSATRRTKAQASSLADYQRGQGAKNVSVRKKKK